MSWVHLAVCIYGNVKALCYSSSQNYLSEGCLIKNLDQYEERTLLFLFNYFGQLYQCYHWFDVDLMDFHWSFIQTTVIINVQVTYYCRFHKIHSHHYACSLHFFSSLMLEFAGIESQFLILLIHFSVSRSRKSLTT